MEFDSIAEVFLTLSTLSCVYDYMFCLMHPTDSLPTPMHPDGPLYQASFSPTLFRCPELFLFAGVRKGVLGYLFLMPAKFDSFLEYLLTAPSSSQQV